MKIKKNDNVIVIAGKDKGKTGKVSRAFPAKEMVLIPGLNIHKKHKRPTKGGEKGQVVDQAFPMHVSNVMLVDGSGKRTRTRK
jgi:large subunit ribosomal protein L24